MKTVGTWSIDKTVKDWIDRKIANKSQFVNSILKNAMLDEIIHDAKKEQRPKCPVCRMRMGPNRVDDESEWMCGNLHCSAMGRD